MRALADLLYPELCAGCRRPVRGALCRPCAGAMRRIGPAVCLRCGAPGAAPTRGCRECRRARMAFDCARQVVAFEDVARRAIHGLKYRNERSLAGPLGSLLAGFIGGDLIEDLIGDLPAHAGGEGPVATWVPTPAARIRDRGYDHARLLAESVAGAVGWPVAPLLARTRDTPPQAGLDVGDRRRNVHRALVAAGPAPPVSVVVDDVYTTGATASEAARALKAAGAKVVVALAVARAVRPDAGIYC